MFVAGFAFTRRDPGSAKSMPAELIADKRR
jgi:hypothetical protein